MRRLVSLLVLLLSWNSSNATLVTIEPDDYAAGTNISNMFRRYGITLSVETLTYEGNTGSGVPIFEPTLSLDVYTASLTGNPIITGESSSPNAATGQEVFAWDPNSSAGTFWGDMRGASCLLGCTGAEGFFIQHVLRLDFSNPISSISALGWFSSGDPTSMFAYDVYGNPIGACVQGSLSTDGSTCAQRFPTADVNVTDPRVGWGDISISAEESNIKTVFIGGHLNLRPIDRIIVDVPEPNTLVLFGTALLGFAVTRRRKGLQ